MFLFDARGIVVLHLLTMGRPAKPERLRKSAVVSVRMTPKLKSDTAREARRDDLEISEWVRLLVCQELIAREKEAQADKGDAKKAKATL